MGLVDDALQGSVRALARLATHVENDTLLSVVALDRLYPLSGRAHTIGVTGPPGAGKSTLVNELIGAFRRLGRTVAVIAIDPSSPLTGGATLGDRIRMLEHQGDPGVFIRSTASRGRTGGLAPTTAGLLHLFDAIGFDVVIVETVGIGQEEVDIAAYVDSVVLVQVPGLGDAVQALKAGILEIADLYVVNKADMPAAHDTVRELRALLTLAPGERDWIPPVLAVSARDRTGIDDVVDALTEHRTWLNRSGSLSGRRQSAARKEIALQVTKMLDERLSLARRSAATDELVARVANRETTPRLAADAILAGWSVTA